MRYIFLLLLLAGGYYGWDYYQTSLVPRHEEIKALEQEPHPEVDAAQLRFDELAELHEKQADRLQDAIRKKEEAVRKYWDEQMRKADQMPDLKKKDPSAAGKNRARSAENRIAQLLEQYDQRSSDVDALKSKLNTTRQQLSAAQSRLQEQIRQVETRLDINRIQRAEASNASAKGFKVKESRAELLKLQESLPRELDRITRKGDAMLMEQTEAYEKAHRELLLFQSKVDRKIADLRDAADSPLSEEDSDTALLAADPRFRTMMEPYEKAVSHEESLAAQTETDAEEQAKLLHGLKRVRDGAIEEKRSRLQQEEQLFFTGATVVGVVLLISTILSFSRRR